MFERVIMRFLPFTSVSNLLLLASAVNGVRRRRRRRKKKRRIDVLFVLSGHDEDDERARRIKAFFLSSRSSSQRKEIRVRSNQSNCVDRREYEKWTEAMLFFFFSPSSPPRTPHRLAKRRNLRHDNRQIIVPVKNLHKTDWQANRNRPMKREKKLKRERKGMLIRLLLTHRCALEWPWWRLTVATSSYLLVRL